MKLLYCVQSVRSSLVHLNIVMLMLFLAVPDAVLSRSRA